MADANTHATRRSLTRQAPKPAWLPRARATPLLDRVLTISWLRKRQGNDWFAGLAILVSTKKNDAFQGRMLAKVYIFLREFIPRGLVGRWAHISGREVMEHLLSDNNEQCVSRHSATRSVDGDFKNLEKWMARGETWQDALENAKAEAKNQRHSKRKTTWYAPALFSPAAILALLALAYPDQKYYDWIATLQIGWMMTEARETLEVREGFWKGLTSKSIPDVFAPEKPAGRAEVELLLDYNRLFGRKFTRCRRDIRPYIPNQSWRSRITVADTPSDVEDTEDDEPDSDAEGAPQASRASSLSSSADGLQEGTAAGTVGKIPGNLDVLQHLDPEAVPAAEVKAWLAEVVTAATHKSVLFEWSAFWAERARSAQNFQEQVLIHSLILQSMRRLKSFYSSGPSAAAAAEAYMLLDMGDGQPQPRPTQEDMKQLGMSPAFTACSDLHNMFKLRARATATSMSTEIATLLNQIFERQAGHIISAFRTESVHRVTNMLVLERYRSQAELDKFSDPTRRDPSYPHTKLWDEQVIATLKLTDWQVRESFRPAASLAKVLTDWQLSIYNESFSAVSGPSSAGLSTAPAFAYQDTSSSQDPEKQEILAVLLSDLTGPAPPRTSPEHVPGQGTPTASVITVNIGGAGPLPGPSSCITPSTSPPPQVSETIGAPQAQAQHPPHDMTNSHAEGAVAATPSKPMVNPFPYSGRKRAADPDQRSVKTPRLSTWSRASSAEGTQAANVPGRVNPFPFVGKDQNHSPAGRATKAPRVGGPITEVIIEELAALKDDLGGRIGGLQEQQAALLDSDRQQSATQLKALGISIERSAEDFGAHLSEIQSSALTDAKVAEIVDTKFSAFNTRMDEMTRSIQRMQDETRLELDRRLSALEKLTARAASNEGITILTSTLNTRMDEMTRSIQQMQDETRLELDKRLSAVERINARAASNEDLEFLTSTLQDLKNTIAKPVPCVGEPGYLTSECPAPEGTDQKAYEAQLSQAAIYYFSLFGHPSDCVPEEGESFEATMQMFPSLPSEHLVTALKHMHMQVYNQPMGNQG